MRTYLDHNATTPLRPQARKALLDAFDLGGNASSIHAEGRAARALVEASRKTLADALGVLPAMIIFTGVGTEANNWVVKSVKVDRLVISAIEHSCILDTARATGKPLDIIPVNGDSIIDLEALEQNLADGKGKALVCLMLANNETGVIQPVAEAAQIVAKHGALIHTDAVQGLGKIDINFGLLGVDTMTLSAHKVGGPQGVGALIVREGVELEKYIHGGGQELGRRGGTENIAGIAGFAAAVEAASQKESYIKHLRDSFESKLQDVSPDVVIFGKGAERLPNTSFFAVPGMKAQTTLINLDMEGIAVSTGAACSSGKVKGSRVLHEMGISDDLRQCALRISFGWNSTEKDVTKFIEVWQDLLSRQQQSAA